MILRICPYQILKYKQCSHFLKTILSIVNWLISRVIKVPSGTMVITLRLKNVVNYDDLYE